MLHHVNHVALMVSWQMSEREQRQRETDEPCFTTENLSE